MEVLELKRPVLRPKRHRRTGCVVTSAAALMKSPAVSVGSRRQKKPSYLLLDLRAPIQYIRAYLQ